VGAGKQKRVYSEWLTYAFVGAAGLDQAMIVALTTAIRLFNSFHSGLCVPDISGLKRAEYPTFHPDCGNSVPHTDRRTLPFPRCTCDVRRATGISGRTSFSSHPPDPTCCFPVAIYSRAFSSIIMSRSGGSNATALRRLMTEYKQLTAQGTAYCANNCN
jgi:hypothetical protein